jgi:hypothetical protein
MFCPKLDSDLDIYTDKLTDIFNKQDINSVTTIRMEVPCCGGVESIVREAMKNSGKSITIKDYTISLLGEIV